MIKTKKLVSAACVALFAACAFGAVFVHTATAQTSDPFAQQDKIIPVGEGEFRLVVKRGPVNVFTYRPKSFTATSPIWVVIHGQKRDVAVQTGGIIRNNKETSVQGATRFQRGHFYINRAAADAKHMGAKFAWHLREVPGAGHSDEDMAPAAAEAMMERR